MKLSLRQPLSFYFEVVLTVLLFGYSCIDAVDTDSHLQICLHHCKQNSLNSLDCQMMNSTTIGRCCVQTKGNVSQIIGLDLSDCDISVINKNFTNMPYLMTLLLQDNPLKKITREDFFNTSHIDVLTLPKDVLCPGGPKAWMSVDIENDTRNCRQEVDTCQIGNITCPNSNSECKHMGPNLMWCECLEGFEGYKCLRKGKFPATVFTIGLGVCTVVVSAVLWIAETRCKRKSPHVHGS